MKNEVKWKDYTICRWVVAMIDDTILGEFDSMVDAKKAMKGAPCTFKYAAAEEINEDGDVNPAVYGNTLKEAMDKIKSVL
jgi:hypothetical protein